MLQARLLSFSGWWFSSSRSALLSLVPPRYRRKRPNLFIYRSLAQYVPPKNVRVRGEISEKEPIAYSPQTTCHMLILWCSARRLPGNFIAKSEVKKWPSIWLDCSNLTGTVFVSRKKSGDCSTSLMTITKAALNSGKNLILFPEGTTSDGKTVMPFKSSLFKIRRGARHYRAAGNFELHPHQRPAAAGQ